MYKDASKPWTEKQTTWVTEYFPGLYGKTPNTRLDPHPGRMISVKRKWTKDKV